jgi:tetratricopeptide (TPR) repeat protein
MMWRAAVWLALLVLSLTDPVQAQRRPRTRDGTSVRGELAAVLLQSGRYDEAAREYRALIAREPGNAAARLGLAQALAWGDNPRIAERELRVLSARWPSDREIAELLRSVRESLEPGAAEAAAWLAERPGHTPFRLALARALVREGRAREAVAHYDRLLALDSSTALMLEGAHANFNAGRRERALQLLRGVVARTPADSASRHALAGGLAEARQIVPAIAQYDTLIAWYPGSELLLARGYLHLARGDRVAAEADASASLGARPSAGAYLLLGELQRWRGDLSSARVAYERARALRPNDLAISTASAQLLREQRPVPAFMPADERAPGWHLRSTSVSDNTGLAYATLGARRDIGLARGVTGSMDIEVRYLTEEVARLDSGVGGLALGFGLSGEGAYGPFLARLNARGGTVYHTKGPILMGAFSATAWFRAWGLSLEHTRGPAYPSLLTAASIRPPDDDGAPLTETTTTAALGGPLGGADVAFSVQRADVSDDNRRSTVQALLRFPMVWDLTAIYAGTGTWYAERSSLYWDPLSYVAAAAGLEYAARSPHGFSFASRVLAGPARIVEEVIVRNRRLIAVVRTSRSSLQLSGSGYLSYRTEAREVGIAVTYGDGRAGEYRRFEATVFVGPVR